MNGPSAISKRALLRLQRSLKSRLSPWAIRTILWKQEPVAYWENGKCYFHGSSQSQSANNAGLARMLNIPLEDLVFINEATGGFGSKNRAISLPWR